MPYKDPTKQAEYFREYHRVRKAADPAGYREMHLRAGRLYKQRHPERLKASYRKWDLKKLYGMTEQEFRLMFEQQEGLCGVCSRLMCMCRKGAAVCAKRAVVDHDHTKSGRKAVRGLLCSTCNMGLGSLRDSPRLMPNAIRYLETS